MNGLDWVLAGIGAFSVIRGFWRGAISQVFGIMSVLGAFVLASNYYQPLTARVAGAFPQISAPQAVSFTALFLLTWICIGLFGYLVGKLLHGTGLGFLDRLLGGVVGVIKAVLIAIVLISALTFLLPPKNPLLCESCLTPHVQEIGRLVVRATPESVQTLFDQKQKELKRYWIERGEAEKKSKTESGVRTDGQRET